MYMAFIKGTCLEMCPVRERKLREKEGLLHMLELPPGICLNSPPRADPLLTVKSFSRSAAGQETPRPNEVRPPDILLKTVEHLLSSPQVQRDDISWHIVYDFVFDRLRAVRQDMVMQGLATNHSIKILEKIVRFHCYAGYRLSNEPMSRFDAKINSTHLLECLKRLLVLYDELDHRGNGRHEMEALYLLWGLGDPQTLTRSLHLPPDVRDSPSVRKSFALSRAMWLGNYAYICSRILNLPLLLKCAAVQQLPSVRRYALQIMSHGFSSRNLVFPIQHLSRLLLYQTDEQTVADCQSCGLCVKNGGVVFNKTQFNSNSKVSCRKLDCVDEALQSVGMSRLLLHPHNVSYRV